MNRTLTLVILALSAGCASRAPAAPPPATAAPNPSHNSKKTPGIRGASAGARIYIHPRCSRAERTDGHHGPDAERAGRELLLRYGALYAMGANDDCPRRTATPTNSA